MKIKFTKDENGISAFVTNDSKKEEVLSNLKLIEGIYTGETIEQEFDEKVSPEEKEKIQSLIDSLIKLRTPNEGVSSEDKPVV